MFVVSVKSSKVKIAMFSALIITACVAIFALFGNNSPQVVLADKEITLRAGNEKERISFLSQFGWSVDIEPFEVKEVVIPSEFNETYIKYNELQKSQDFDLEKYKGEKVKMWTYTVKNYPGYEEKQGYVVANLLVYKNAVIGGDVSCLDGKSFVQGFDFPDTV